MLEMPRLSARGGCRGCPCKGEESRKPTTKTRSRDRLISGPNPLVEESEELLLVELQRDIHPLLFRIGAEIGNRHASRKQASCLYLDMKLLRVEDCRPHVNGNRNGIVQKRSVETFCLLVVLHVKFRHVRDHLRE